MHFRRKIALALTGAMLAVPALSSCGFNKATDRVYTPAAGVNDQDTKVDVLGAVGKAGLFEQHVRRERSGFGGVIQGEHG